MIFQLLSSCFSVFNMDTRSSEKKNYLYFEFEKVIFLVLIMALQQHLSNWPLIPSCRGIVEETPNTTEHGRPSVLLEKYASATKMQPQSSGSLRSNAGIEKGKEIAARLNIHRIHSQLRGLDSTGWFQRKLTDSFAEWFAFPSLWACTLWILVWYDYSNCFFQLISGCSFNTCNVFASSIDIGTCAITAIPFEKSKVLFGLEEMEEFSLVDETNTQATGDLGRSTAPLEKWGWIMFECGIENLTVKGKTPRFTTWVVTYTRI